jgi:hypothetical protein
MADMDVRDEVLGLFEKLTRVQRKAVRDDPVIDHLPLIDDDGDRFSSTLGPSRALCSLVACTS